MRAAGYRIVRTYVEPILDEQTLRSMDAAIYLASRHGIVMDMTVFSQWLRTLGFPRPDGGPETFEFRGPREFNTYGLSFRHLDLQREYIATLARRWRKARNVIFNLSNETYLRDPDQQQMDPEAAAWQENQRPPGIVRDSLLIRKWGDEMTAAIRQAGASQAVIPGHMFLTEGGGDTYQVNRHGEIEAIHSYLPFADTAALIGYVDPVCSARPVMLEEFGFAGWNNEKHYDAQAHAALAMGAAAALSYEWGVRWLAPEMPFYSLPLRDILSAKPAEPRWFQPLYGVVKDWPERAAGIYPSPSGFYYASIYTGTPFPAAAARALARLTLAGEGLGRGSPDDQVFVVIPTAFNGKRTDTKPVVETMKKLWAAHIPFAVLQEDCLSKLPGSAKFLIAPTGVTDASRGSLQEISRRGVEVLAGQTAWASDTRLPRTPVTPASVHVISRSAGAGTLYTLWSDQRVDASLSLPSGAIQLGIDRFAVVHRSGPGVRMVEAAGEVSIAGERFCKIEGGRAILKTDAGDLRNADGVDVIASAPGAIEFTRPIQEIEVWAPGDLRRIASERPKQPRTLDIDDQMLSYVVRVRFGKRANQ